MPSASNERLQQLAVTSIATLLLGVAGIVGLKQPEITLWAVFLAGVCYTFAIHKDLAFKNYQTITIVAVLFVASAGTQIWLVARHKEQQKVGPPTSTKVTGAAINNATTDAPASVANTGTIGSVSINGESDHVAGKKTTPKSK